MAPGRLRQFLLSACAEIPGRISAQRACPQKPASACWYSISGRPSLYLLGFADGRLVIVGLRRQSGQNRISPIRRWWTTCGRTCFAMSTPYHLGGAHDAPPDVLLCLAAPCSISSCRSAVFSFCSRCPGRASGTGASAITRTTGERACDLWVNVLVFCGTPALDLSASGAEVRIYC